MKAVEPVSAEEISAEWLSQALGVQVASASVTRIGSGQIGSCLLCDLTGEAVPSRVVVKLPTDDPGTRAMLAGAYRSEVNFYRDLAATVAVNVPHCYAASDVDEDGRYALVLEDLSPSTPGDQLAGGSPEEVSTAAVNLAGLHGPRWCDPSLLEIGWLKLPEEPDAAILAETYAPAVDKFLDHVGHLLTAEAVETLRATVDLVAEWFLGRAQRYALLHGDYRLDNLMFHPESGAVRALDWQTLSLGPPARDLAYLVSTSLHAADRRTFEHDLVNAYQRTLLDHGVTHHDLEECWEDYRFAMLHAVLTPVFGCAYGTRTERGNQMFAVMVERACTAIRDHHTLDLIPAQQHR